MRLSLISRIGAWLLNFIDLQLFLMCVSLPILIGWGIPLSAASLLGNLIFMPFLTMFLLLASIIFFCELLHIPQGILIYCLEKVSSCWLFCMQFGQRDWLFGFPSLPLAFLLILTLIPFLIICSRHITQQSKRIGFFILFLTALYGVSHVWQSRKSASFCIQSGRGKWQGLHAHNQIVLIDVQASSSIKKPSSTIDYTLIPQLIKETGSFAIDHLIITKPGKATFETLDHLLRKTTVRHLYIAWWEGKPSKHFWRNFFTLKETMKQTGCCCHVIKNKPVSIMLSEAEKIEIEPDKIVLNSTKEISYPAFIIRHVIDNKTDTLYDASQ